MVNEENLKRVALLLAIIVRTRKAAAEEEEERSHRNQTFTILNF